MVSSLATSRAMSPPVKQLVTPSSSMQPSPHSVPKLQPVLTPSVKPHAAAAPSSKPAAAAPPSRLQALTSQPPKAPVTCTIIPTTTTASKPVLRVSPMSVSQNNPANRQPSVVSSPKPITRIESARLAGKDDLKRMKSIFYMECLQQKRQMEHRKRLEHLGRINTYRCAACPIYGRDLIEAVTMISDVRPCTKGHPWGGMGYVHCLSAPHADENPRHHWYYTHALGKVIHTPQSLLEELEDIVKRFVFAIPSVTAPRIQMHMSHPPPSKAEEMSLFEQRLCQELSPTCTLLHDIVRNTCTQFPELRLIQYDCGKLQTLDHLLWSLKSEGHRVLIFTQMTRMLDVLEQFLNYHGHTYLRLDGNTRVDQRQALMERFNADKRIFCFILSTRSGGIGVNLTGADTVIFYDSDWNPTMDAQAQDRCHRIGQTRDVHIYRLISERTVEENILKKANQKRLLGDLAIEGGNFTTAFFKVNAIQELFGIEVPEKGNIIVKSEEQMSEDSMSKAGEVENFSSAQLEQALGMAEEENDIMAARTARAEAAAELAEFDETVPFDTDSKDMEEKSPAEEELDKLMEQLSPVEKYAMQFLESIQEPFSLEQLKQAEEEIEAQKKDWELGHLKALKEEEERMSALLEDQEEPLLTCSREDAYNQVYISLNGREQMPLWAPPTPPQDENDIYLDYSMCFLYETSVMPESQLPPIYVKKEMKRLKVDNSVAVATRKQKIRKEETVHVPRSLFDRPTAAILKMRREVKLQRVKGLMAGASAFPKQIGLAVSSSKPPVMVTRPAVETSQEVPEWLIYEDRAILQVIQEFQDLPLNLMVLSPAHIPNWDLVADVVNLYSRAYRSQKLCRQRYELTIVPREEGKILYDTNPKKQKKSKGIYKTKNNKPMKTSQLLIQDKNRVFNEVYMRRFDAIKAIANKRTPTLKSLFVTPTSGKNHKHIAVLAEAGISYDQPLTPVQVAAIRAERIAREKQKSQAAAVAAAQAAEQQLAAQRQQQQQVQVAAVQSASAAGLTQQQAAQAVIASLAQSQQLQAVHASQLTKAALQTGAVTSVSLAKTLGSSIVVNTGGLTAAGATAGTLASISKALGQVASSGALAAQGTVQAATVTAMNAATLRAQRSASVTVAGTTSPTMTVQEMVAAAATGQIRGLTTSVTAGGTVVSAASQPAVVSVAGLTSVQVQAATQRLSASTLAAAAAAAGTGGQVAGQAAVSRNLTHAQVHVFRQTALLHQQRLQEQHLKQQQQLKRLQVAAAAQQQSVQQAVSTGKVASNVASTLSTNMAAVAAAAQQRAAQQQPAAKQLAGKQAVARAMTEAEMAQLLKRQQLQQQQKQAVTQLTTAQLLAHAQLQVQQQQQQSQQSLAGTVQAPVATLVKTVSAPTSLGAAPSVTIPVSAVTMAGVNINVSLPQAKGNVASPKVSSTVAATAATVTQQQLRQLQLQQQLFQQHQKAQLRQQQQKAAQMAQVQSKAPVTQLPAQIGTVQIVQQQGGQMTAAGQATSKGLPAAAGTVTVQQIQQVFKQVSAAASAQGAGATTVTPSIASASVSQAQLLPHAVLQAAAFSGASSKSQALATVTLSQAPLSSSPTPSSSLVGVSATGTIPTNTALVSSAPVVQARVIPVSQATTATAAHGQTQYTGKQAIQVVAAAGLQTQAPLRSVSEAGMLTGTLKQTATHSTLSQPVVTSPMTTSAAALLKSGSAVVMSGQPQTAILQQVAPVNSGLSAQQAVTLAMRAAAAAATQGQGTQPQIQIQVQQAGAGQTHHQPQIVTATQQGSGQALLHTHSLQQQPQSTAAVLSASLQPGTVPSSAVQSSSQTASTNLVPSLTTSLTVPTGIESSHFSNAGQLAAAPQAQLGSAAIVTATPASASTTAQVVQAAIQMAKQQQQQQQQRQSPYTMRLRNSPKP